MKLLHLAHRGEAQSFISSLKLAPIPQRAVELYGNDELLLLVSGEGIYAALEKTNIVLAKYPEISEVINYGICGALDSKVAQLGQIYSIKSIYCYSGNGPEFHSFHTSGDLDLVTSSTRVTSSSEAQKLLPIAPLVDRELWAVARAAKLALIPFRSFKLVSDIAGEVDCLDIKHRALEFSQKLYAHFNQHKDQSSAKNANAAKVDPIQELEFYCTKQQKIILRKLLHALSLKYQCTQGEVLASIDMQSLNSLDITEKQRTTLLLEQLQLQLNPLRKVIDEKLQNFSAPFTAIGAQVTFDPAWEKKEFTLQMKINHQTNLHKLQQALGQVQFAEFHSIMEGKLDD